MLRIINLKDVNIFFLLIISNQKEACCLSPWIPINNGIHRNLHESRDARSRCYRDCLHFVPAEIPQLCSLQQNNPEFPTLELVQEMNLHR